MILYKLVNGAFSGDILEVDDAALWTEDYVTVPPPPTGAGEYAVYSNGLWKVVTELPVPEVPVPPRISMLQATLALMHFGVYEAVDAAIRNSGDPVLLAYWTRSTEGFERHHPAILLVQAWMGWEDESMDEMFRFAATCT